MGIAGANTIQKKGDSKFSLVYNMHTTGSNLREIIKHIYIHHVPPPSERKRKKGLTLFTFPLKRT